MDYYNSYLKGINQTIGENARFARQFQVNQQTNANGGGVTTGASQMDNWANGQGPLLNMMLMMLFQLLGQSTDVTGGTSPSVASAPYVPGLHVNQSQPYQNPAVVSLETRFTQITADTDPESPTIEFSPEDVAAVRADLRAGQFSPAQLGQALMYELDQAPDKNLGAVTRLITDLTDSGDLNIAPFLQNDYLLKLPPQRQEALMSALKVSGLRLDNDKPNARLIGFMLDSLAKPGDSESKAFIQRFLQDFYGVYGKQPETPVGDILAKTLSLAGISASNDGKLIFGT